MTDRMAEGTPPPACGRDAGVLATEDDHPPFEQRFNLSDDRQRLIEVVTYKGPLEWLYGLSPVWHRNSAAPARSNKKAGQCPAFKSPCLFRGACWSRSAL